LGTEPGEGYEHFASKKAINFGASGGMGSAVEFRKQIGERNKG
tara:strand:+ start:59 stop:187 length:129 start_codon:yes stop_codon:yes gene_type:complete